MDRVITYNLNDNFILRLADHLEDNYIKRGKDLSRLSLVFGGKRPALFLKKELSRRIKKGFLAPRFFSIDEFVEYILLKKEPFKPVSDLDACFSIYSLAKEHAPDVLKERESFCAFLPWAREILSFIEQLDLEEAEEALLENVQSKAKIGFDVPQNINALLGNIILIRRAYQGLLKGKKTYTRGMKYLLAAEYCQGLFLEEFEQIFFCGFFYLHKTEMKIIKSFYDQGKATLVFQGSQGDWGVLKTIAQGLSISILPPDPEKIIPNFTVQAGFDAHSQVCLAREALKDAAAPERTVIVLPEPDNCIPLLAEISSQVKDFNVSLGYPLKRSSIYALFVSIFKAQSNKKGANYYARDYLEALSHPLIKNLKILPNPGSTRVLAHKIEEVLLGMEEAPFSGSIFVDPDEIMRSRELYELSMRTLKSMGLEVSFDELQGAVKVLHKALFKSWEGLDNLYDFSVSLGELISLLIEKSPLKDYPLNLKMAEAVLGIKDELQGAVFNKEKFPQEDIFRIFENRLENQAISFSGSPLKGLQVLGLFETRSLNFENVIILDMNESVLPNLKIYEPLIPREVMINLGINRLEKEDQIQRYQFLRLISAAKNAILIYKDAPDKEKSRFLEELAWEKQKLAKGFKEVPKPKASFKIRVLPKRLKIAKDGLMIDFLGSREYSSSSINTYLACPLKFYYQYVLGLKEKEGLLDEPEAKDVGTFVHQFLEESFKPFLRKKPVIDASFKKGFLKNLEEKFDREFQNKARSDSFMLKEVLILRMRQFLEKEKERKVERIMSLEKEFGETLSLGGRKIRFKAIVDRIDLLEDKSLLILDYKTGGSDIMPKTEAGEIEAGGFTREAMKESIRSFQLPLYLYLISLDPKYKGYPLNACLYHIKSLGKGKVYSALFKEGEGPGQKDRLMQVFMKGLDAIIREILDAQVPFQADEENLRLCANCPFFYLCR